MGDKVVAVVPAAGQGLRMGSPTAKQFLCLGGISLLGRVCATLERVPEIEAVVVAAPPGQEELARQAVGLPAPAKLAAVVAGGAERQYSVAAGVAAARDLGAQWVVVHDAVRPLASAALFSRVLKEARLTGAAIAACASVDTVKESDGGQSVRRTLDRERLWLVQTPQAFRLNLLLAAQAQAQERGLVATDEAGLMEACGVEVRLVPGERGNMKITTPEDLGLAQAFLGQGAPPVRVGQGVDVHRLVPGRPLILGGVRVPFELGLLGHSDADVLTHAVMDALLSAAGLGDIGRHFSDRDPAHAGADSLELLARVRDMLAAAGWRAAQVSVTLVAQAPRIAPHAPRMAANLARVLELPLAAVNVAATTSEGLGFAGRGEGMSALASATLVPLAAPAAV